MAGLDDNETPGSRPSSPGFFSTFCVVRCPTLKLTVTRTRRSPFADGHGHYALSRGDFVNPSSAGAAGTCGGLGAAPASMLSIDSTILESTRRDQVRKVALVVFDRLHARRGHGPAPGCVVASSGTAAP